MIEITNITADVTHGGRRLYVRAVVDRQAIRFTVETKDMKKYTSLKGQQGLLERKAMEEVEARRQLAELAGPYAGLVGVIKG